MTMDPDRYECPDHHTDLTELVQEALEELGPVAYGRHSGPQRFQVIVTCPGGTEAHRLTCTGTQTP